MSDRAGDRHSVEIDYKGATISVRISPEAVSLLINGILRERKPVDGASVINLSTSWQTDYEWHEFIEANVENVDDQIMIRVIANQVVIHEKCN